MHVYNVFIYYFVCFYFFRARATSAQSSCRAPKRRTLVDCASCGYLNVDIKHVYVYYACLNYVVCFLSAERVQPVLCLPPADPKKGREGTLEAALRADIDITYVCI